MRWYITDYIFLASIVAFASTEGYALFNKTKGDTFSERWWAWLKGKVTKDPVLVHGSSGDDHFHAWQRKVHEPIMIFQRFTKLAGRRKTDLVAYQGIKLNTFRWFATAGISLLFFVWLWLHLNFGMFAGG